LLWFELVRLVAAGDTLAYPRHCFCGDPASQIRDSTLTRRQLTSSLQARHL
jgi:hypothetical protein